MAWQENGSLCEDDGDVGGDVQVGPACSRRYFNPDLPGRLITIYLYPVREADSTVVQVQMQTEFMICQDIEDPGGTEEWSDYRHAPVTRIGFGTVEQAVAAAKEVLTAYSAKSEIDWNGSPF